MIAKTETSSKQVRDIVEQTDQSIYCPTSCRPSCCAVCSGPSPFVYVCIVELIAWQHLAESRLVQFKQRQTLLREKEETLNGSNKLQRERNEGRRHARRRFKTEEFCARATHSSARTSIVGSALIPTILYWKRQETTTPPSPAATTPPVVLSKSRPEIAQFSATLHTKYYYFIYILVEFAALLRDWNSGLRR